MNKKSFFKISVFFLPALIFTSCHGPQKEYLLKVKLQKLSTDGIYDKYLVSDVIFDATELNTDSLETESRKLFLQGIDQYKNKKNPAAAVKLFISSILVFPEAKTYYELGNAVMASSSDSAGMASALSAYEVAEFLHFQPISNVYLQEALANNAMISFVKTEGAKNHLYWQVINNLNFAFCNGFSDTASINKNPALSLIVADPEYQRNTKNALARQQKGGENSLFALFKKSFPAVSDAFEISVEKVDMSEYKESISYDFAQFIPEMENTSFGREVSHDYFYVAKVAETPQYTAIIYTSVNFYGGEMQPVNTSLVTYDASGNILSRRMISCQCSAEKIKKCKIENNSVVVEEYNRVWADPIDKVSFEENKVASNDLVSTARYRINDKGEIIDEDVPAGFKDSTYVAK